MRSGGRIVNIGSIAAKMGHSMLAIFAASKAALTSLTVSLAEELGPKGNESFNLILNNCKQYTDGILGITVNIAAQGPIATEAGGIDPAALAPVAAKIFNNAHLKRAGTTDEVAEAVRWLTSPLSGYITGQLIPIDGGAGWP